MPNAAIRTCTIVKLTFKIMPIFRLVSLNSEHYMHIQHGNMLFGYSEITDIIMPLACTECDLCKYEILEVCYISELCCDE